MDEIMGGPGLSLSSRAGLANTHTHLRLQLQEFINSKADPIIVYRWIIVYMINLPNSNLSEFVIFRKRTFIDRRFCQTVVDRMAELGVIIDYEQEFGYVVCNVEGTRTIANKAYEIEYFIKNYGIDYPFFIDYDYYMKGLISLEKMLSQIQPLPPAFREIQYQREIRNKIFCFADNPIEMMASMYSHGSNLNSLLHHYDRIAEFI